MATDELLTPPEVRPGKDAKNSGVSGLTRPGNPLFMVLGPISAKELKRRMWHMLPGLLPVLSWIVPHKDPLSPTFKGIAGCIVVGLSVALLSRFHTILRTDEHNPLAAVFGYAGAVLMTLILFPAHAELGMTVLVILAFGDGSATLGGILLRGPTLPWNSTKTWAGLFCFLLIGAPLASLAYWAEAQPVVGVGAAVVCGCSAAIVAALFESIDSRWNDNIRVGLAASITVAIAHGIFIGFA